MFIRTCVWSSDLAISFLKLTNNWKNFLNLFLDPQTVRLKYSRTNTLPEPHPTLPNMVDGDIGTVRDIRVIANKDYKARNCNELTLKKGR